MTRSYRVQSRAHNGQNAAQQSAAEGEAGIGLDQQRLDMPDTFVHQPAGGSRSMRFKQQQHAKQQAWQKELDAFMHNQHPAPSRQPAGKQPVSKQSSSKLRQAPKPPGGPAWRASISIADAGLLLGLAPETEQDAAACTGSSFSRSNADPQQLRDHEHLMLHPGASPAMAGHEVAAPARRTSPQPLRMTFSPDSGPHAVIPQERPASRARSSSPHDRHTARVTAGGWHGHRQSARSRSPVAMPALALMSVAASAGSMSPEAAPDRLEIAGS